MGTKGTEISLKVLMFPWLAYGHITPFLELAKKLSDRGSIIYFCSTPINLEFIKKKIPSEYSLSIRPAPLHLPETPELPLSFHTTNGLPPHLMDPLRIALVGAKPNLSSILENLRPDLVIYDAIQPWTAPLASVHGILAVKFSTTSAAAFAYGCHVAMKPGVGFPFPAIHLSEFHQAMIRRSIESGVSDAQEKEVDPEDRDGDGPDCNRFCNKIMLVKSSREIEGQYMDYLSDVTGMKIIPVGALFPEYAKDDDDQDELIQWLETKSENSSVFVSFGSEYFLKNEEIEEIAFGLELSDVNFIWVLRFPMGEKNRKKIRPDEVLPQGFLERTKNRGKIVEGWAPQTEILAHRSVGGFICHCGWNSVLESVEFGVPIIAVPMHLDQPLNGRLAAEIGAAVEVTRDRNGKLQREVIAQVIKQVVADGEGENMRTKLKDLRGKMLFRENEELDEVVDLLNQLK